MARYELRFKNSVINDLRALPRSDVAKVLERIDALRDDPRPPGSEKLSGHERYRVRQGSYRILYEIEDQQVVVTVFKVGHRREVYRP